MLILWMLLSYPPFFLFIWLRNIALKQNSLIQLERTLKKEGLPRDLRKAVKKNYKEYFKLVKIRNMPKFQRIYRQKM